MHNIVGQNKLLKSAKKISYRLPQTPLALRLQKKKKVDFSL